MYQKTQGFLIFKSFAFRASIISKNISTGARLELYATETEKYVLVKYLLVLLHRTSIYIL